MHSLSFKSGSKGSSAKYHFPHRQNITTLPLEISLNSSSFSRIFEQEYYNNIYYHYHSWKFRYILVFSRGSYKAPFFEYTFFFLENAFFFFLKDLLTRLIFEKYILLFGKYILLLSQGSSNKAPFCSLLWIKSWALSEDLDFFWAEGKGEILTCPQLTPEYWTDGWMMWNKILKWEKRYLGWCWLFDCLGFYITWLLLLSIFPHCQWHLKSCSRLINNHQ